MVEAVASIVGEKSRFHSCDWGDSKCGGLEMARRTTCSLTSRTHPRTGAVPTIGFALIEVDIDAAAGAFVALAVSVTFFAN